MKIRFLSLLVALLLCESRSKASEPIAAATALGYCTTVVVDACAVLSEKVRDGLYGNTALPEAVEKELRTMISGLNIARPLLIKQSYWPWDGIAGNIFSNHDTLFVSKKVCDEISQGLRENKSDIVNTLDFSGKKELTTSLLMIANKYDDNLVVLSIAVPVAVQLGAKILHFVSREINSLMPLYPTTCLTHKMVEKFDKSFKAKALTSLCILGAYILYQRHSFGVQALALLQ